MHTENNDLLASGILIEEWTCMFLLYFFLICDILFYFIFLGPIRYTGGSEDAVLMLWM